MNQGLDTNTDEVPEVLKQQYLTVRQFGDLFGVANSSVYSMIQRGRLKIVKFGSVTLIPKKEVAKYTPVMKNRLVRLVRRKKGELPEEYEDDLQDSED